MKMFTLPPRTTTTIATAIPLPLKPAHYLRLRRAAAGLSQREVAERLARNWRIQRGGTGSVLKLEKQARILLEQLETDGTKARFRREIDDLEHVVPLDVDVYFQLANEPADRHPFVCLGCGCSTYDPCSGSEGVCSCATGHACTRCIGRTIDMAEAA